MPWTVTGASLTVTRDFYDDPALFVKGEETPSIEDFSSNFPFATTFQVSNQNAQIIVSQGVLHSTINSLFNSTKEVNGAIRIQAPGINSSKTYFFTNIIYKNDTIIVNGTKFSVLIFEDNTMALIDPISELEGFEHEAVADFKYTNVISDRINLLGENVVVPRYFTPPPKEIPAEISNEESASVSFTDNVKRNTSQEVAEETRDLKEERKESNAKRREYQGASGSW